MSMEQLKQARGAALEYFETVHRLYNLSDTEQGGERMLAAINAFALCEMALCMERQTSCLEAIWQRVDADSKANWIKLAEAQAERKGVKHGGG